MEGGGGRGWSFGNEERDSSLPTSSLPPPQNDRCWLSVVGCAFFSHSFLSHFDTFFNVGVRVERGEGEVEEEVYVKRGKSESEREKF